MITLGVTAYQLYAAPMDMRKGIDNAVSLTRRYNHLQ
jgi:hypothetical protein